MSISISLSPMYTTEKYTHGLHLAFLYLMVIWRFFTNKCVCVYICVYIYMICFACVFSPAPLCDPWTVARHAPLNLRFPRQEYCKNFCSSGSSQPRNGTGVSYVFYISKPSSLPLSHLGSPTYMWDIYIYISHIHTHGRRGGDEGNYLVFLTAA